MLPEDKSLQIHKVATDGIGQQSPGCHHKIPPEPGRKPRNVPLSMGQLVVIQIKQQTAVVVEHRRHGLDLHGVGIKQHPEIAQVAVNIEDNRIQNHPPEHVLAANGCFAIFFALFSLLSSTLRMGCFHNPIGRQLATTSLRDGLSQC